MTKNAGKITFDPIPGKEGEEWFILAKLPDGREERITGFPSPGDALGWLGSDERVDWLKERGQ